MPLDHITGAGLIAGATPSYGGTMKLIVTAPILIGGEHQEIGTEIEVSETLGRELLAGNKALPAPAPAAPATEPARGESARSKNT